MLGSWLPASCLSYPSCLRNTSCWGSCPQPNLPFVIVDTLQFQLKEHEEEALTPEGELRLIPTHVPRRFLEVGSWGRAGFKPGIAANVHANFHANQNETESRPSGANQRPDGETCGP